MKPSFRLCAALAAAAIVRASFAAGTASDPDPAATTPPPLSTGAPAPAFTAGRLDGGSLSLASLRGRVVLLNFWGVSCPPCRIEMPELQAMHRRLAGRGLVVLGVTEMNPTPEEARRFLAEIGATYPVVLDPGERLGALYRIEAHPTTFVIDARGTITFVNDGYLKGDEKHIEAAVLQALEGRGAGGR